MTSSLTNALIIVMAINVMLFLGQIAVLENSPGAEVLYRCEGNMLGTFSANGCADGNYVLSDTNPGGVLPDVEGSVSPETGAVYTDAYTGIKGWMLNNTGLGYLINVLSAPSNLLKAMGLPTAFSFAIGALWYGVTLFLIIAFLFGRDA